jgi:hypothetical protein
MKYKVVLRKVKDWVTDEDPRATWCAKTFRKNSWKSSGWLAVTFEFTREKDAVYFALMWGGK